MKGDFLATNGLIFKKVVVKSANLLACRHVLLLFYLSHFELKCSMSGLTKNTPRPIDIRLHQASRLLEIKFDNNTECMLSCELLRVYSPSAEVKGHGPGQETLQIGKELVNITAIEPIGNYAVKLVFSDGHDTGLYSWDYLYYLGENYQAMWQDYIAKLEIAGHKRKEVQ
jgi:DUF971 family protein